MASAGTESASTYKASSFSAMPPSTIKDLELAMRGITSSESYKNHHHETYEVGNSPIERLPVEILQSILLYSENYDLPRASRTLKRRLMTPANLLQVTKNVLDPQINPLEMAAESLSDLLGRRFFSKDYVLANKLKVVLSKSVRLRSQHFSATGLKRIMALYEAMLVHGEGFNSVSYFVPKEDAEAQYALHRVMYFKPKENSSDDKEGCKWQKSWPTHFDYEFKAMRFLVNRLRLILPPSFVLQALKNACECADSINDQNPCMEDFYIPDPTGLPAYIEFVNVSREAIRKWTPDQWEDPELKDWTFKRCRQEIAKYVTSQEEAASESRSWQCHTDLGRQFWVLLRLAGKDKLRQSLMAVKPQEWIDTGPWGERIYLWWPKDNEVSFWKTHWYRHNRSG